MNVSHTVFKIDESENQFLTKQSFLDAPHSVQISVPQIDLLEGERYPEKPVQCSAFGNPNPTYYWTFSPLFTADNKQQMLNLNQRQPKLNDAQSVVGIGPRLTLNMTTMSNRASFHNQISKDTSTKTDARISTENLTFQSASTTVGPALFRASRTQSGNYTCVSSNQHGISMATMTINVFCKYFSF